MFAQHLKACDANHIEHKQGGIIVDHFETWKKKNPTKVRKGRVRMTKHKKCTSTVAALCVFRTIPAGFPFG